MAIDMDNMLAGFSSQVISATGGEVDFGGGVTTGTIAACILRAEDILDVLRLVQSSEPAMAPCLGPAPLTLNQSGLVPLEQPLPSPHLRAAAPAESSHS